MFLVFRLNINLEVVKLFVSTYPNVILNYYWIKNVMITQINVCAFYFDQTHYQQLVKNLNTDLVW